ncbi:MAG: hypothetical protein KDF60_19810 [Calditrichaeota bacterium]|nr:hypothetical protein [Calditrichota bacterium]
MAITEKRIKIIEDQLAMLINGATILNHAPLKKRGSRKGISKTTKQKVIARRLKTALK